MRKKADHTAPCANYLEKSQNAECLAEHVHRGIQRNMEINCHQQEVPPFTKEFEGEAVSLRDFDMNVFCIGYAAYDIKVNSCRPELGLNVNAVHVQRFLVNSVTGTLEAESSLKLNAKI